MCVCLHVRACARVCVCEGGGLWVCLAPVFVPVCVFMFVICVTARRFFLVSKDNVPYECVYISHLRDRKIFLVSKKNKVLNLEENCRRMMRAGRKTTVKQ